MTPREGTPPRLRPLIAALALALTVGCGGPEAPPPLPPAPSRPPLPPPLPVPGPPDDIELPAPEPDLLTLCTEVTNELRATVGAAPLAPSADVAAYATEAARADALSNRAHSYTSGPSGPRGVGFAENAVVRWPLSRFGTIPTLVVSALTAFWEEGPGGPHYENMRGPYASVGCGIYQDADQVTLIQHFR